MKKKTTTNRLKFEAQKVARGLSASMMFFFVLMLLSISFILFQLKEFQITKEIKDIRELRNEIEELRSLNQRYQSKIKNELAANSRISSLSKEMGLEETTRSPEVLIVDKKKLDHYAEKDKKISQ